MYCFNLTHLIPPYIHMCNQSCMIFDVYNNRLMSHIVHVVMVYATLHLYECKHVCKYYVYTRITYLARLVLFSTSSFTNNTTNMTVEDKARPVIFRTIYHLSLLTCDVMRTNTDHIGIGNMS